MVAGAPTSLPLFLRLNVGLTLISKKSGREARAQAHIFIHKFNKGMFLLQRPIGSAATWRVRHVAALLRDPCSKEDLCITICAQARAFIAPIHPLHRHIAQFYPAASQQHDALNTPQREDYA